MLTTEIGDCVKFLFRVPFGGDNRLIIGSRRYIKNHFSVIDEEGGG
jgi:hypothetical protein